jgi:hypothetical protein
MKQIYEKCEECYGTGGWGKNGGDIHPPCNGTGYLPASPQTLAEHDLAVVEEFVRRVKRQQIAHEDQYGDGIFSLRAAITIVISSMREAAKGGVNAATSND